MPNRTIYLTDEQNETWKRSVAVLRDIGDTSVGTICVDALSGYAERNMDIASAVRAAKQGEITERIKDCRAGQSHGAKQGTEKTKDVKPEV